MTEPERVRRPQLDHEHPVYLLAMDHRDSLAKKVYGIEGEPTSAEAERIASGKRLIFEGLTAALAQGADVARTGVLVDERYGAEVARSARAAGLQLAMPIERSGQPFFRLEYGGLDSAEWLDHIDAFDPDYVKVLVRDNTAFDPDARARQKDDLAQVSSALHDAGRTFLVELLVPPTDEQDAAASSYDDEVRPALTQLVMGELQDAGVEPDVWKIEGLDTPDAASAIAGVARADGRESVQCIILGRDAPMEELDHWLETAAPIAGFSGFAIGRSIWEQPLKDHLDGKADSNQLVEAVASNYLGFVADYRSAADASAP